MANDFPGFVLRVRVLLYQKQLKTHQVFFFILVLKTVKKHPVIVMAMICVASQSSALSETAKNTWDSVTAARVVIKKEIFRAQSNLTYQH